MTVVTAAKRTVQIMSRPHYAEGIENRDFTLKSYQQTFSVHTTQEKLKNAAVTSHLHLFLRKTGAGEYHDYRKVAVYEKLSFRNVFRLH